MTTEEERSLTPDDRWSAFTDPFKGSSLGTKPKEDPGPDLTEYIEKVIEQRSPRKRHEKVYKMVSHLVRLLTGLAQALTTEWKLYLQTDKKNEIRTSPVRTLAVDQYECMIPLMRPLKPDAFKLVQRGLDEMLPHQYHIMVNSSLSKEEALLVRREWGPNVDKHGYLVTNEILDWFNTGISKACSILMAESKNISVLRSVIMHDGTISVHTTISSNPREDLGGNENVSKGEPSVVAFCINIYPVFAVDSLHLPTNLSISSPLPTLGPFSSVKKTLKEAVLKDVECGKLIVVLEPKKDVSSSPINCYQPTDRVIWRLNLNFTEQHVYRTLDNHCLDVDFRQVLVLMNIIREQFPTDLGIINNEILVNTMFVTSQKEFSRLPALHNWFLELVKAICKGLKSGFLPSFYLPRQNLFSCYCIPDDVKNVALLKLEEILKATKHNPRNIYNFTGYVEKKKNRPDTDSSEEDDPQSDKEEETNDVPGEAGEPSD